MYRVGLEAILGFTKRDDRLSLDPRVPAGWDQFTIEYRHGRSLYRVLVQQPAAARRGNQRVSLDGRELEGEVVTLGDDGREHQVVIRPRDRQESG
jgi:cellobiose phosphorylase